MLSVEEALDRILSFFSVLETEHTPILDAKGQVLSETVVGRFDVPPVDNSAMDGYAVKADNLVGASMKTPVMLQVIGSIAAGELPNREVNSRTAIRIMTGAAIPHGANAIVPFERTDDVKYKSSGKTPSKISIYDEIAVGANIRPAGQDIKTGQVALEKGTVLRPAEIGVLASLGRSEVRVVRRPIAAILATGDELIEPKDEYAHGKTYNSNSYSLAAAVSETGGIPMTLGIATDDMDSLADKLLQGLESDILITSAGVSKGDYDMVKDILVQHGDIEFWSVQMRPSKPLAFGLLRGQNGKTVPHLGLPGNPVSALVAFEQFGRAAICKMLGKNISPRPTIEAILEEPIHNTDGRRVYARAIVTKRNGTYYAKLTGHQGSNLLTSMARANGLAICPENIAKKNTGESVTVQMIDWPEVVF